MEEITSRFGKYRSFEKALMISQISDGIRESKNYKDVFMVYSSSTNYRIVDMSVCKCNCPNLEICSHILSILIRYSNSDRMYLYRLFAIKELSAIKFYFGKNQLEKIQSNIYNLLNTITSKTDVIKASSSLIIGIYHRFLTKIENGIGENKINNNKNYAPPPDPIINKIDKGISCFLDKKPCKLGYLASLNGESDCYQYCNYDIINSIRTYKYNADSDLDVFEFNKATSVYTKLISSNYISFPPKPLHNINIKEIIKLIRSVPPLTDINAALNWKINFYKTCGPLLEFITSNMEGNYIVTSHRTVYKLQLPSNSYQILFEEQPDPISLASQILLMLHNTQIQQYIDHLKLLFTRCKLSLLLDFIAIMPSELISSVYDMFLGTVLYDRNIKFDEMRTDKNLVLNLYIAYSKGYLPTSVLDKEVKECKAISSSHVDCFIKPTEIIRPYRSVSVISKNPKEHIESIRQKKLALYNNTTEDPISRILDKLASNLYSNSNQVLYELIQNADDNVYIEGTIPSLLIVHTDNSLTLYNNEIGFSSSDIESICDLGNSSKLGSRYTGEFGIGFKSVFKISNEPYIISNGYQIKFNPNGVEKIIPEWVENLDFLVNISNIIKVDVNMYNTIIHLPLVNPIVFDVSHELMLYLKQLTRITYIQIGKGSISETKSLEITSIQLNECTKECNIIYNNDKIYKYIKYTDINSNIQLSFPFETSSEYVYSCLPIQKFGLNFAINCRFNLTLDRSNLLDDSYNISIINNTPLVFLNALNSAKSFDKNIYYLIFSTIPNNARGIFSILNYKIIEIINDSNVIPTANDIGYVKPSECIYLKNSHGVDNDLAAIEDSLEKLINSGLFKNVVASDTIPYSLVLKLNLPRCDLWKIIDLFEEVKCIDPDDAIELLKIVEYFVRKDPDASKSLINVVQKSIKFPFIKGEVQGFDFCNNIYIGKIEIFNFIFNTLNKKIQSHFDIDFLLKIGFIDCIYGTYDLNALDISLDDKKAISLMIVKSLSSKDLDFSKFQNIPIFGIDDDVYVPLSSPAIPLFEHEFYFMLKKYNFDVFTPLKEYYPEISTLVIGNVNNHLKYILSNIKMNTELGIEYFNFIKFILSNLDETKKSNLIEEILFPLGSWEVINDQMVWSFEYLSNITNYYFIQYFTISTPEIIYNNRIPPNVLILILKCLKNENLYKSIQADKHLLLHTVTSMWVNRFNKNICDALIESLNFIYNELSYVLDQNIIDMLSEDLIFTFFQERLTSMNYKYAYINTIKELELPLKPLQEVYSVKDSFWKMLNISEYPRIDVLLDMLKEDSLGMSSVLSIVIYLYRNMNSNFIESMESLNIIPGYFNDDGKISLYKPSEIDSNIEYPNLSLFGLEKLQKEWNDILTTLKINFKKECIKVECNNYIEKSQADEYKFETGFIGEKLVYEYLLEKYGSNVIWLNQKYEQGLPYDITLIKDGVEKYIEVKSSSCNNKKMFEISYPEWLFSQIKGDDFIIYRVNGIKSKNPLITILPNPYHLWKNKKLAFCLSL